MRWPLSSGVLLGLTCGREERSDPASGPPERARRGLMPARCAASPSPSQRDRFDEIRSTFDRQAGILRTVHPGLRGKLKGFVNPHLLSARGNNLLRNDT
jgi:hypothetical protein